MAGKLQKSYFEVLGLCCATEVPLVEETLKPLNGVETISVILPTKTVIVFHDTSLISQSKIVEALNKARLEASVRPQGDIKSESKWPAPTTMVCGILLALSFLKYVYEPLQWLALVAVAVGLPPVLAKSLASIRNLTFNINILVVLAVGGTIALQDYMEAASVVFLYSISTWLESKASHKAMATMSTVTSMTPQKATIAKTGEQVDVNVVPLNTVLAVKVGDAIPIDGIVVDGECEVDEKALTGESFPVGKQLGSTVWAGTINVDGYISVSTTALAKDCVVARMAKLVEEAHSKKSKAERLIDSFSKYYIPAVLLISAGLAAIPAALRVHHQSYWFHLALVFLVSTCPCALIISTPVTIFCALSKAATTGLLIKGGDYLEILAKIKIMAFDKTGTVTKGEFVVTEFCSIHDNVSLETLLYWVSSIESKSSHPMAAALIDYARSNSVEPEYELVEDFQNYPGEGVYGKIAGNSIYIGNWKIGYRAGSNAGALANFHGREGRTNGYVFLGGTVVGIFSLSDGCRSGAMEAIKELKSLGIKTAMLTGDTESAAILAQDQLDQALDTVYAGLLPEDKARIIENFKKEGPTAMVGDGINDALALAIADIGISMGISGSALAMETGNIILLSNDIQKIPKSIQLARRSFNKLVQNVIISVVTKGAILALAFAGYPLVWAAVLTDVGTCLIVILNSMLLLQDTKKGEVKSSGSQYGTFSCSCTKAETILPVYNQYSSGCCEKPSQDVASGSRQQQKSKGKRWNLIGGKECKKTKRCNDGCCGRSVTYHMVSDNEQDSASNRSRSAADSSCSSSFKNQSQ